MSPTIHTFFSRWRWISCSQSSTDVRYKCNFYQPFMPVTIDNRSLNQHGFFSILSNMELVTIHFIRHKIYHYKHINHFFCFHHWKISLGIVSEESEKRDVNNRTSKWAKRKHYTKKIYWKVIIDLLYSAFVAEKSEYVRMKSG